MDITAKEWEARSENGLPPYHAVDQYDVGFKYHNPETDDPALKAFFTDDLDALGKEWKGASGIRGVFSDRVPLYMGYSLPAVEEIRPPPKGFTACLYCDGVYFDKFGAALLASLGDGCHVHLMDGDWKPALKVIESLGLDTGLYAEQPDADPEYYHSIRFIRWYQFMKKTGEYSCLLEVDAIANRPHTDLPRAEVGMRLRPARLEPWNVCNASVCVGKANRYWKGVADYIYHYYLQDKLVWQIDQAALWAVWKKQENDIHTLGEKEVSYDYDDDGIIWCNSGRNKWLKNDPDRQKYRSKFNSIIIPGRETPAQSLLLLEKEAKKALEDLKLDEAKRLYLRLLRRCFEGMPQKPPYIEETERQNRKIGKILYLPVEISARELSSREWLAEEMARRGWQIVVGARWQMQEWENLPPGVILWKSANTQDVGVFTDAINAGHLIALMDEELFPMRPSMELYGPSVDRRCLDYADVIFAHSEEQKKLFEELTETPVEVAGNPRTLLTERAKRGKRVLICTMTGTLNNYGRTFPEMVFGTVKLLGGVSEETFDFLAYQICHEIQGYGLIRQAISDLKPLKPLIRCHPSEDVAFWRKMGDLDDRTPFTERLNDARCVVHVSGCGTGLESAFAGVPTVRLGEGGHGLSSMIGKGVEKDIFKAVAEAKPQKKPEFAEVTLPDAIEGLYEGNAFKCSFDIEKAYQAMDWEPLDFHKNKFPKDPAGKIIAWRTALWKP